MSIAREFFPLCNEAGLEVGQRVAYVQNPAGVLDALGGDKPSRPVASGMGTVTLIWLGIEETVDVATDAGAKVTLFPAMGDEITALGVPHPPEELDALAERVFGPGNWIACPDCPDSLGLPSRHHVRHHDDELPRFMRHD